MGALGDVPVEAGIVDEHDGVGPLGVKVLFGLPGKAEEGAQMGDDLKEADQRQVGQRVQQLAAFGRHAVAAEALETQGRLLSPQTAHEVGAVEIAARLSHAEEYGVRLARLVHGCLLATMEKGEFAAKSVSRKADRPQRQLASLREASWCSRLAPRGVLV